MSERQRDFELLQEFARRGNQSAFAEMVHRHIDLVYATALRNSGDPGAAEDIAQDVFSVLARKAWQFAPDDSVAAWLYRTTLHKSRGWLRGELRRRRREETAAELGTTMKTPDEQSTFRALVPLLDEALLSLREKDRTALLLRFYESRSLRDVGASLGIREDAAQKRVASALEKLAGFFQRRGFRTTTVAIAAAALQHTAASASAATVSAVAAAALRGAPPALAGLAALLSRLTTLTQAQTAAACLAVAAAPVVWQWQAQRASDTALAQASASLATAQNEFNSRQTELVRLKESAARLNDSLADTLAAAARGAETARKFAGWKERARARLLAADYQWPDDLPFVRIPKVILPQLEVGEPVTHPGRLKQAERELLGLTPAERERAETLLRDHFAAIDTLVESSRYETNRPLHGSVPQDALASQVWEVPALGDEAQQRADALKAALKTLLGEERWPILERQLAGSNTDNLRRVLNLDAGEKGQELAVWVQERDGKLAAGYTWGQPSTSFSSSGMALSLFLPDAKPPDGISLENRLGIQPLSDALTRPALNWLRQQAEARLDRKGDL
jgi:RNA polymerase sigma factor (sigma-70 family)